MEYEETKVTTDPQGHWTKEVDAAEKRVLKYQQAGDLVVHRFVDQRGDEEGNIPTDPHHPAFRLNLFHTHVSTLMAMLYGRVPRTDVSRRFGDSNDDPSRVASELLQRLLNTSVEQPGSELPDVLRACLQDRLLSGHGIARVRYDMESKDTEDPDGRTDEEGNILTYEELVDEDAPVDYVHWRDFLWGHGRMWKDLPWIAFKLYKNREEVKKRFGEQWVDQLTYEKQKVTSKGSEAPEVLEVQSIEDEAEILEIWDRRNRKVLFWSRGAKGLLEKKDDPLGLRGFFPCPQPMIANATTTLYLPTSDFKIAQDLYNEIDILQTRIGIITKAVKVIGMYDQKQTELQRMFREGLENDLIPVDNWAAFAEAGGIRGVVDWYPVEDVVATLTQLETIRENTINLLYQVTGLSDILRGAAPAPRESAESARSRTQFASVRVQHLQDEFARFASELMSLKAQIIAKHWDPETILSKSNAEFLQEEQESLGQAIGLIKDDTQHWPWQIEIKPESIAMIDYAAMRQERTEFLTVMATYIQSMVGLVQHAPQAAPLLFEMMKWGLAGFKGSQQLEGVVDRVIKAAVAKIAELEAAQAQGQGQDPAAATEAAKAAAKMQEIQAKNQAKMQEQNQKHQQEMEAMVTEFQLGIKEINAETEASAIKEKVQAHYNIMEKRAAESIAARQRARSAKND